MNEAILATPVGARPAVEPHRTSTPATSAVSWAAILAGAAGAAALSLILLILGAGLGLSSVSPWSDRGATAATFGVSTIAWLTFTQLAASGMGGYLAGRLRTRWAGTDVDEVYFRDTAHGFLAWATASLVTAALLSSVIGALLSGGAQVAGAVAGGTATAATAAAAGAAPAMAKGGDADSGHGYFVDSLFRSGASAAPAAAASSPAAAPEPMAAGGTTGTTGSSTAATGAEAGRIFATALADGSLAADDARYLGQMVAQRTGLSQAEAEKRVTDTFARMQSKAKAAEAAAREAADKARKASAYGALWLFISLLIGAFVASLAATFGGRQRDLV